MAKGSDTFQVIYSSDPKTSQGIKYLDSLYMYVDTGHKSL